MYGNKELLSEHFPMMCDWLALDNGDINNPVGKTDAQFLASSYYYLST